MNKGRRRHIANAEKACELLRLKVKRLHDDELHYREGLWRKGKDESDTADVSDDAIDALNKADTYLMQASMQLGKAQKL